MVKKNRGNKPNKVKFEIAKLNYIDLKASQEAQSGKTMYYRLNSVGSDAPNFVINGKEISFRDTLPKIQQKSYDNKKNYHSLLIEAFRETFKDAGTQVPSESILKELITNCNQTGY